jgi:hypothetical protein
MARDHAIGKFEFSRASEHIWIRRQVTTMTLACPILNSDGNNCNGFRRLFNATYSVNIAELCGSASAVEHFVE